MGRDRKKACGDEEATHSQMKRWWNADEPKDSRWSWAGIVGLLVGGEDTRTLLFVQTNLPLSLKSGN
jgi:hypothetical protein